MSFSFQITIYTYKDSRPLPETSNKFVWHFFALVPILKNLEKTMLVFFCYNLSKYPIWKIFFIYKLLSPMYDASFHC